MNIAVLVSGSGTNLQALIDAHDSGALAPARIRGVLSNRPGVRALERAQSAGIDTAVVDHKDYSTRADFELEVLAQLNRWQTEAIALAGFMRILTSDFVARFPHRIINTHPALCPAFPGVQAPKQAIDAGVKVSGCTVHFVDAGVDTGPIIFQACVPIAEDDNASSLHQRIQVHEHKLLPRAVQMLAAGKLAVDGRRVRLAAD